jgi:hypothetical protein
MNEEEIPQGSYTTLRESLNNHPDLYDLIKVLGLNPDVIEDSRCNLVTFIAPTIKKSFTFTKTDGGYDLKIETPESVGL